MSSGFTSSGSIRITGADGVHEADVELQSGKKRLLTDATVQVQELLGQFVFSSGCFTVDVAGGIGDTVRVQIPDDSVDVTTTVTATEVGDIRLLAQLIVDDLNADSDFIVNFVAGKQKDNALIVVTANKAGAIGDRDDVGDFLVTTTGTTVATKLFDGIARRSAELALFPHPLDPKLGTINVTGELSVIPGTINDRYIENATDDGTPTGSADMTVDGSVTAVEFVVPISATQDTFITEMRFYGSGNGIKFGQFLNQNTPLTVGIKVEIKSDDKSFTLPTYSSTEDLKNKFSFPAPGSNFRIDVQAGGDEVVASFNLGTPFVLRKSGTFTTNDFIKITIQDDLSTKPTTFEFLATGFLRNA